MKFFYRIIGSLLVLNFLFAGMGLCFISLDHDHEDSVEPCMHIHHQGENAEHHSDSENDCHQNSKDKKHNGGKLHCHSSQIIVCLTDVTVFNSSLYFEPYVENPLTSFISHILSQIDHIPIHLS